MRRRTPPTSASALALLVALLPAAASGIFADGVASTRLDPRLERLRSSPEAVRVWVEFQDKGVADDAAHARALARAEAALTPRSRARRLRAGVRPIVNDHDLPVSEDHLVAIRRLGFEPHAVSRWLNRAAVLVPGARLDALTLIPGVARVTPVARVQRSTPPVFVGAASAPVSPAIGRPVTHDTAIDHGRLEDTIRQIGAHALHDSNYTGAGVLVCILDAGFNRHETHEALRDRIPAPGHRRDFVDGDTTVTDTTAFMALSHGTWVLGCLAGDRPGEYVGAAFDADLALARTENEYSETPAEMLYWAQGAEWADSLGADLISSSLGYFTFDDPPDYTYADMDGKTTDVSRAAQIAASKGILMVNSVGNEGASPWRYLIAPADVHGDSLIAVGAVDGAGNVAGFSSFGPTADGRVKPDLAARGTSVPVVSTSGNPTGYSFMSGTSLSAPLIAGLAACLIQARPGWSPQQVIRALRETASRSTNPDSRVGFGIPNGARALLWPDVPPEIQVSGKLGIRLASANPFDPARGDLHVQFAMDPSAVSGPVHLRVHDGAGRAVRTLWSDVLQPGAWAEAWWNGRDEAGQPVAPGLYWVAVAGGSEIAAARIVLLR